MGPRNQITALLLGLLLHAGAALAGPPLTVGDAAALLSRYPAGSVPVDPTVMTAIAILGERGTRDEIGLLRNLTEHERDEVAAAAVHAIGDVRDRQRVAQREAFAASVADPAPKAMPGLGPEGAACATYSRALLGTDRADGAVRAAKGDEDAETLLAHGRPRKAVAALVTDPSPGGRKLAARAWEDLGETRYAVQTWALLAASGDEEARGTLEGYGIDVERLLLGLLVAPDAAGSDAGLLEVLVRVGDDRTVRVLAERSAAGPTSERATATDALARLIHRDPAVSEAARAHAVTALRTASVDSTESIRAIAAEALLR